MFEKKWIKLEDLRESAMRRVVDAPPRHQVSWGSCAASVDVDPMPSETTDGPAAEAPSKPVSNFCCFIRGDQMAITK